MHRVRQHRERISKSLTDCTSLSVDAAKICTNVIDRRVSPDPAKEYIRKGHFEYNDLESLISSYSVGGADNSDISNSNLSQLCFCNLCRKCRRGWCADSFRRRNIYQETLDWPTSVVSMKDGAVYVSCETASVPTTGGGLIGVNSLCEKVTLAKAASDLTSCGGVECSCFIHARQCCFSGPSLSKVSQSSTQKDRDHKPCTTCCTEQWESLRMLYH